MVELVEEARYELRILGTAPSQVCLTLVVRACGQQRLATGSRQRTAANVRAHEETPGLAPTKEGVLEFFRMYRAAFPNLQMGPEDVLASGDKVVARVRATGTHQGELVGIPGTGKSVDVQLIDMMRFDEDGLVAERWGVVDMLAMMQQLGVAVVGTPA